MNSKKNLQLSILFEKIKKIALPKDSKDTILETIFSTPHVSTLHPADVINHSNQKTTNSNNSNHVA